MEIPVAARTALAFVPLAWLMLGLGLLRMRSWAATLLGYAGTALLAWGAFGMAPAGILEASLEGAMLAICPILWVIFSALLVYNLSVATGGMRVIIEGLSSLSSDRRAQAVLIAFSFGGFLEAVSGFGTAVAIPAGILIAMGFEPLLAAVVCLVANTVPVAFGVIGIPIITLSQVTSLPLDRLSVYAALQLAPFTLVLPLLLAVVVGGGASGLRGCLGLCLAAGAAFAVGQTLAAASIGAELPAVVGALLSLAATVLWLRLRPPRKPWRFPSEDSAARAPEGAAAPRTEAAPDRTAGVPAADAPRARAEPSPGVGLARQLAAWSPYILVLSIVALTRLAPELAFLNAAPFAPKRQFYFGPGGKPLAFQLATGSGTVLFVSALLGGLIQGGSARTIGGAILRTGRQMGKTAVTVLSILALAKTMGYSGMVDAVATALAAASGGLFPVISPAIGALGTFLTGSDTSSNVLFGELQKRTAARLGLDQPWVAAANSAGATAGKMISPQSIAVAAASAGLGGRDGEILAITIKYCLGYVAAMGLLVFAGSQLLR